MRARSKVRIPLFLTLLILSSSLLAYHADVRRILFSDKNPQNTFSSYSGFVEEAIEAAKGKNFDKVELKAVKLMISKRIPDLYLSIQSVHNIYALVSCVNEKKEELFAETNSLYFYSGRQIPLDVQFYDDGAVYIPFWRK